MDPRASPPCRSARTFSVLALAALAACGGGPSMSDKQDGPSTAIDVRVSAGAPVTGAMVTVYAVDDGGEQNPRAGDRGVLGSGGPTDADGRALVRVSVAGYSGPIQVVAGGSGLAYVDPTVPLPADGSAPRVVQIPATFSMSSFVPQYRTGEQTIVPVTLLTTLADRAALAYARGLHPSHPEGSKLTKALAARDALFVKHFTNAEAAWAPSALRTTTPVMLGKAPATLVDRAYAALHDVALNQLARDIAVKAGYGAESQAVNAITLTQLLEQDVDADAMLDGRADGGRPVAVVGTPAVAVDSLFLRKELARSLDVWIRNRSVNKSGISSPELAAAQVYAAISTDTSDLFGNAPVELFDPTDRAAPVVSLATPASVLYTLDGNLVLRVRVEDVSGLRSVSAQVGGRAFAGVLEADGLWTIDVGTLPAVGHNPITVWGEDNAEPAANSGFGIEGHQLALDAVYDPVPPTATYDAELASYVDERAITVATNTDGTAKVPAVYLPTQGRTTIPRGGHVYKASTRLAAAAPLAAAELEGANVANVPVLRFAVPYNAGTDAPIVQANFSVAVSCAGCAAFPPATGALLPSATAAAQALLFDLPLAADLVPALGQLVGPGSIAVSLALADAAGNTASVGPFEFTFHVLGPPIAAVQDTAYGSYAMPGSTFPYRLSDNSYATLWNVSSTAFRSGLVRLVRYVISNPSPHPIAIAPIYQQAAEGSWQAIETWWNLGSQELPEVSLGALPYQAQAFSVDGFTFFQPLWWATPFGTTGAANTVGLPLPCGDLFAGYAGHRVGETWRQWICVPYDEVATYKQIVQVGSSAQVEPVVYRGPGAAADETEFPRRDVTGSLHVVPGASANAPGTLVLYLTRPLGAARTSPLLWNRRSPHGKYQTWDYEIFDPNHEASYASKNYWVFNAMRAGKDLQSAKDVLNGTLYVNTQGLLDEAPIGEAATRFSAGFASTTVANH